MRNEYRSGYAEGGFLDDGASVDPVSGNEVPTGSLAEEVRDDIPAQLSEGEFVVPADVVRFIGLDKLMKMRESAKAGLATMEAEGQMGGSPAPMQQPEMDDEMEMDALIDGMDNDDFEGAAQMFAEGGAVTDLPSYENYTGGRKFGENTAVVYIEYTNDAGDIIKIGHVKGQPVTPIPQGYYRVGSKPSPNPVTGGGTSSSGSGQGDGKVDNLRDPNNPWQGILSDTDTDTIKLHHNLRSDKITRNRNKIIKGISGDILDGNIDPRGEGNSMIGYVSNSALAEEKMLKVMLPDAIKLYKGITENPSFLDDIFYKDKTKLEVMVMSVNQTQNARKKAGLPDPDYVKIMNTDSDKGKVFSISEKEDVFGKTPSLSKLFKSIAEGAVDYAKSGGMIQAFFSSVGDALGSKDKLKAKVEEIVSTIFNTGNLSEEAIVIAGQVDTLVEDNVATSTDLIPSNRRELYSPDGSNVNKLKGVEDFDDFDNMGVIIDNDTRDELLDTTGAADTRDEALDNVGSGTPYSPAAGTEYSPEGTGVASLTDVDPSTTATYDDEMRDLSVDPKILRDDIDKAAAIKSSQEFFDEMSLTAKENAALSTGAKLGSTGVTGTTALDIGLPTVATSMSSEEMGVRELAVALGGDPDEAWAEWQQDNPSDTATGLTQREQDEIDRKKIRDDAAAERAAKIAQDKADRAKEREIRASEANVKRLAKDRRDEANTEAAKNAAAKAAADREAREAADRLKEGGRPSQNPYTVNSGGDGRGQRQRDAEAGNGFGQGNANKASEDAGQTDYGFFNYGGLATKNKPEVKKMRKDPTSGLAAKKKSKQKAQAKKGALAAKRT